MYIYIYVYVCKYVHVYSLVRATLSRACASCFLRGLSTTPQPLGNAGQTAPFGHARLLFMIGKELTAPRTDRPSGVASPVTTNHAAEDLVEGVRELLLEGFVDHAAVQRPLPPPLSNVDCQLSGSQRARCPARKFHLKSHFSPSVTCPCFFSRKSPFWKVTPPSKS